MNDFDIVTVRIEDPCRIVARIVFETSLRCFLALAAGGHRRSVECIYLSMVLHHEINVTCTTWGSGFPSLSQKKALLPSLRTLQIGVSGVAFVICKVCDPKWHQGLGVKSD